MRSKYYAKKVVADGFTFDSHHEYLRYQELVCLKNKGKISELTIHPVFELQKSFEKNGVIYSALNYEADFSYVLSETMKIVVEDVKGFETDEFKIHKKLFEYHYPELTLTVLKYSNHEFITVEDFNQQKKEKISNKKAQVKELKNEVKNICKKHGFDFDLTTIKTSSALSTLNKQIKTLTKFLETSNKIILKLQKLDEKEKLTNKEQEFLNMHQHVIR